MGGESRSSAAAPPVRRFALLMEERSLLHVFAGRRGGISPAPFDSLNMSVSVGDQPDHVYENRRRLVAALGRRGRCLAIGNQIHEAGVWQVGADEAEREGWRWDGHRRTADATITRVPGVVLLSLFADCPIVLLYDPRTPAVGLVHSGWRGTAAGIVGRAIEAMQGQLGSRPQDLRAGITPHIRRCCFEVGPEVPETLAAAVELPRARWTDGELSSVDLAEVILAQLEASGVRREQCEVDETCTRCERESYFSHRGDGGRSGRNGVAAMLVG